jgi:uncharacterized protein (TIGR00369 family)
MFSAVLSWMGDKMANWPQISIDTYRDGFCFGCGQENPIGLKLNFQWDGKTSRAEFTPTRLYQGWPGVVHGGIIMCLLDEAMGNISLFEGICSVTAEIQGKIARPALINEPLFITATMTKKTRKLIKVEATISLSDGTRVAEGKATQFIVSTGFKDKTGGEDKPQSDV